MKLIHKFNHNHGQDGRFSSGGGDVTDLVAQHARSHETEGTNTRSGKEWRQYHAQYLGHSSPTIRGGMNQYVKRTGMMAVHERLDGKVGVRYHAQGTPAGTIHSHLFRSAAEYHKTYHDVQKAGNPHRGKDGKYTSGGGEGGYVEHMNHKVPHTQEYAQHLNHMAYMLHNKAVNSLQSGHSHSVEHSKYAREATEHVMSFTGKHPSSSVRLAMRQAAGSGGKTGLQAHQLLRGMHKLAWQTGKGEFSL